MQLSTRQLTLEKLKLSRNKRIKQPIYERFLRRISADPKCKITTTRITSEVQMATRTNELANLMQHNTRKDPGFSTRLELPDRLVNSRGLRIVSNTRSARPSRVMTSSPHKTTSIWMILLTWLECHRRKSRSTLAC